MKFPNNELHLKHYKLCVVSLTPNYTGSSPLQIAYDFGKLYFILLYGKSGQNHKKYKNLKKSYPI